jgi:hypothetical protein
MAVKFPNRTKYSVSEFMRDLKKIDPTPSVTYEVASNLIYYQWSCCEQTLGSDHPITKHFAELMDFMQQGYENQLVRGEFWRAADTPNAAINAALKDCPEEFLSYEFERPAEYILGLLERAAKLRQAELKQHKRVEKAIRARIKEEPKDPNLWNELRLTQWILGKYSDASTSFKTARDLGWEISSCTLVGL